MPWQQQVADVVGELLPNGLPAFREIIVTVPRQQGKTTLVLATEVERGTMRDRAHRIAYTAQTGSDARKKLLNDQVPMLQRSPLSAAIEKVYQAQGNEGVIFRNGSRIDVIASSVSAGHGQIVDLGVIDEAFDDVDDRREQAILPGMVTKPDAQLLIVSTMGTDASVYLNRKIDAGRAAALEGRTEGTAYFEWSIPQGADIDDPASWWLGMPALGHTITEAVVAHAKSSMSPGEFRRAFGNQRMRGVERVIPEVPWRVVQSPSAIPSGDVVFGVDVSPDRDWAAVVSAGLGGDGRPVLQCVDYRPGTGWLFDALAGYVLGGAGRIALEIRGPAGAILPALRSAGLPVIEMSGADVTQACGAFYDAVADSTLWVRSDPRFDAAVSAAAKQPVGDAWRWGRKAGGDVTPLMAATIALGAWRSHPTSVAGVVNLADYLDLEDA